MCKRRRANALFFVRAIIVASGHGITFIKNGYFCIWLFELERCSQVHASEPTMPSYTKKPVLVGDKCIFHFDLPAKYALLASAIANYRF
ncbi:hypothetical protein BX661DRAFT_16164 [Kickxella alabastrina]|uniref:uncharacterized protein n=1 Tax=Kickxella alabastrina TaxID=61397 RepID=UPI00221F14D3|nr:uncharacterized protein BX661DRAFT_16164 [Kickxella alabastrina]KAI7818751.1 hypothetical protein BX661DRAFT_16164 [Kickxella alabastrina]